MDFATLKTLINAGMNEEQIKTVNALLTPAPQTGSPGTATPTVTPTATQTVTLPGAPGVPGGAPAGGQGAAPASAPAGGQAPESETLGIVRQMLGMMQQGNINGISGAPAQVQRSEDILATVLTP